MARVVVTNILACGANSCSSSRTRAKATPPLSPPYIMISCSVQLSFLMRNWLARKARMRTPITLNTQHGLFI